MRNASTSTDYLDSSHSAEIAITVLSTVALQVPNDKMPYKVEAVTESRLLGEAPHWDHQRQHLYYVDAFNSRIHRYIPATGKDTCCKLRK